jgi:hypothetical protein
VKAVTAENIAVELARAPEGTTYILRDARISGKLDLRRRVVNVPIYIQNCEFFDGVDLRNSEFTQIVNFSGCAFRSYLSGDPLESDSIEEERSFTIYRKNFILNEAVFEDAVSFVRVRCEGRVLLNRTDFKSIVSFSEASIGSDLDCTRAHFQAATSFQRIRCAGDGLFNESQFRGRIDLSDASFGGALVCYAASFEQESDFYRLHCERGGFLTMPVLSKILPLRMHPLVQF